MLDDQVFTLMNCAGRRCGGAECTRPLHPPNHRMCLIKMEECVCHMTTCAKHLYLNSAKCSRQPVRALPFSIKLTAATILQMWSFCPCLCLFFFLFSNAILSPHLPCNAQLTVFFYYKQRTQTCLITTVETTWVPFACYLSTFFFPCRQYNFFGFVFLVGVGENHGQIKNKLYEKRGLKLEEQGCHFNNSMICVDSQSFS